jgi:hypothetical protein
MTRIAQVAWLTLAFVAVGGVHRGECDDAPSTPPLFLQASISTAGPYGEGWYLTLAPSGEVSLQVFYNKSPSGSLLARFALSEQQALTIRKACDSQAFFALQSDLAPPQRAFHRPHLQLDIHLGGRHHKVSLYDPAALKGQATGQFLAVWNSVFEHLPVKPSW